MRWCSQWTLKIKSHFVELRSEEGVIGRCAGGGKGPAIPFVLVRLPGQKAWAPERRVQLPGILIFPPRAPSWLVYPSGALPAQALVSPQVQKILEVGLFLL